MISATEQHAVRTNQRGKGRNPADHNNTSGRRGGATTSTGEGRPRNQAQPKSRCRVVVGVENDLGPTDVVVFFDMRAKLRGGAVVEGGLHGRRGEKKVMRLHRTRGGDARERR
jgi:hypothetical protein